ncbi:MAG: efflux transporter outer membrane subunit [Planctomycetota bacterium]
MSARLALVALSALGLGGCLGPRTDVEPLLAETAELLGGAPATDGAVLDAPADRWWERFGDPVLDQLVELTLAGNRDLRQAAATVREAEASTRSARGARGPSLDASFAGIRTRSQAPPGNPVYSTLLFPQLTVSWRADLLGRLQSQERASVAELLAAEEDRVALAHSLIAEAARLRVSISLQERRLSLSRDIVASRTSTLETVEGRYERGVGTATAVDVHLARENLAAARAAQPPLERDLQQALFALDVLLGRAPEGSSAPGSLSSPLPSAPPPPAQLPAALLDRRPDLRAARTRLEGAAAGVDVSVAALYPELSFSAALASTGSDLDQAFDPDRFFANLVAGLAGPIFASGRLRADVDAAEARLEALAEGYAAQALRAAREVQDALTAERELRAELAERLRQRDEARMAEDLARDRYARGLQDLLTVLDTERRRATAEEQVLLLRASVWNARIDLHLALGGDWLSQDPSTVSLR